MYKIDGKKIEELTMFDRVDEWKQVLKTLSERDYIKCINLFFYGNKSLIIYNEDLDK